MPGLYLKKGTVGIVSKSGTLTYGQLTKCVETRLESLLLLVLVETQLLEQLQEAVELLMNDPETECIVMIGEIGGQLEADAAHWIKADGNRQL
jgi:succinyl-CoA synthetase alpha subunit